MPIAATSGTRDRRIATASARGSTTAEGCAPTAAATARADRRTATATGTDRRAANRRATSTAASASVEASRTRRGSNRPVPEAGARIRERAAGRAEPFVPPEMPRPAGSDIPVSETHVRACDRAAVGAEPFLPKKLPRPDRSDIAVPETRARTRERAAGRAEPVGSAELSRPHHSDSPIPEADVRAHEPVSVAEPVVPGKTSVSEMTMAKESDCWGVVPTIPAVDASPTKAASPGPPAMVPARPVPAVKVEAIAVPSKVTNADRHILQRFGRDRCMRDCPGASDGRSLGRRVGERQRGAGDRKDSKARFHDGFLS